MDDLGNIIAVTGFEQLSVESAYMSSSRMYNVTQSHRATTTREVDEIPEVSYSSIEQAW